MSHSGLYCRGIAHRRLEMLSIRKPHAPNLNLWPESSVIDHNSKNACKKSTWSKLKWICKTGSSCVLWPTFGQIGSRGRFLLLLSISTSGLASRAPGMLFFALFWLVLSPYRTYTPRNAFYKKTGCTKSKSVAQKYNSETGSTFKMPEMVRNVV